MKKNLFTKKFFKFNKSIYKYFIVGIICQFIDYISTLYFLNLSINLFFSNSLGYILGSLTSYIGHSKFTFKNTSKNLLSKKWKIKKSTKLITLIEKKKNITSYSLSEKQVSAILELRLQKLTAFGINEIENEINSLSKIIYLVMHSL